MKPFIDRMNRNELFTAICSGMASIAGSMMIGYAGMGVPIDYLLAAFADGYSWRYPVCTYS
ncbi:putative nucleoside transporter [Escherichia coli]|uniref:Putative nucleoside transporter n=1 Tax=Escherichia coli TaxID=562 RepID=A0A376W818_ECOLX|nr:putative nucleoside transporter [Escherichia coli]